MGRRIITTENLEEDAKIENHLRPQLLSDYIGQAKSKKMLQHVLRRSSFKVKLAWVNMLYHLQLV